MLVLAALVAREVVVAAGLSTSRELVAREVVVAAGPSTSRGIGGKGCGGGGGHIAGTGGKGGGGGGGPSYIAGTGGKGGGGAIKASTKGDGRWWGKGGKGWGTGAGASSSSGQQQQCPAPDGLTRYERTGFKTKRGTKRRGGRAEGEKRAGLQAAPGCTQALRRFLVFEDSPEDVEVIRKAFGGAALEGFEADRNNELEDGIIEG